MDQETTLTNEQMRQNVLKKWESLKDHFEFDFFVQATKLHRHTTVRMFDGDIPFTTDAYEKAVEVLDEFQARIDEAAKSNAVNINADELGIKIEVVQICTQPDRLLRLSKLISDREAEGFKHYATMSLSIVDALLFFRKEAMLCKQ